METLQAEAVVLRISAALSRAIDHPEPLPA